MARGRPRILTDKQRAENKRAYARAYYVANPDKRQRYRAKQYASNGREYHRSHRLKNLPEARKPTRPMPDHCELCLRANGDKILCLDHNHITGAFRSWLCTPCNAGIGLLGDTAESLERAANFLRSMPPFAS